MPSLTHSLYQGSQEARTLTLSGLWCPLRPPAWAPVPAQPCCFPLLLVPQCCKARNRSQENPFPVARVCGVSLTFRVLGP